MYNGILAIVALSGMLALPNTLLWSHFLDSNKFGRSKATDIPVIVAIGMVILPLFVMYLLNNYLTL